MRCVLGFDGGGTKTECVALDLVGNLVARGQGPASNPTRIGFDAAAAGVRKAADAALAPIAQPVEVLALCAGLAGTARAESHAAMFQLLQQGFPNVALDLRTDLDLVLAAVPDGSAIVLIVGTGSVAVGRDASGRQLREGGYGPSSSDEGSAYDIGRAAIAAVRQPSADRRTSDLAHQILRHLGHPDWASVDARAAANPDEVYPRVFPVVAASADAGNPLAQSLLLAAVSSLATITLRLARELGIAEQAFPLAKAGGAVGRSRFFDRALDRELQAMLPGAAISKSSANPAETAARIALRNAASREGAPR